MSDDEDTKPGRKRPRPVWDDTKRSRGGRPRRNAPALGNPIVRDQQIDELEKALRQPMVPQDFREDTQPVDVYGRSPRERNPHSRIERLDERTKALIDEAKQEAASLILKTHGPVPDERCKALESDVATIRTRLRILWGILAAFAIAIGGMAPSVWRGIGDRGRIDGETDARLRQLEQSVQHISDRLDGARLQLVTPSPFPRNPP